VHLFVLCSHFKQQAMTLQQQNDDHYLIKDSKGEKVIELYVRENFPWFEARLHSYWTKANTCLKADCKTANEARNYLVRFSSVWLKAGPETRERIY